MGKQQSDVLTVSFDRNDGDLSILIVSRREADGKPRIIKVITEEEAELIYEQLIGR